MATTPKLWTRYAHVPFMPVWKILPRSTTNNFLCFQNNGTGIYSRVVLLYSSSGNIIMEKIIYFRVVLENKRLSTDDWAAKEILGWEKDKKY